MERLVQLELEKMEVEELVSAKHRRALRQPFLDPSIKLGTTIPRQISASLTSTTDAWQRRTEENRRNIARRRVFEQSRKMLNQNLHEIQESVKTHQGMVASPHKRSRALDGIALERQAIEDQTTMLLRRTAELEVAINAGQMSGQTARVADPEKVESTYEQLPAGSILRLALLPPDDDDDDDNGGGADGDAGDGDGGADGDDDDQSSVGGSSTGGGGKNKSRRRGPRPRGGALRNSTLRRSSPGNRATAKEDAAAAFSDTLRFKSQTREVQALERMKVQDALQSSYREELSGRAASVGNNALDVLERIRARRNQAAKSKARRNRPRGPTTPRPFKVADKKTEAQKSREREVAEDMALLVPWEPRPKYRPLTATEVIETHLADVPARAGAAEAAPPKAKAKRRRRPPPKAAAGGTPKAGSKKSAGSGSGSGDGSNKGASTAGSSKSPSGKSASGKSASGKSASSKSPASKSGVSGGTESGSGSNSNNGASSAGSSKKSGSSSVGSEELGLKAASSDEGEGASSLSNFSDELDNVDISGVDLDDVDVSSGSLGSDAT